MSYIFTLTGKKTSILSAEFSPPIYLDQDSEYVMGLTNFETFNAIPNIDKGRNKFYIGNKVIEIPEGSYEIDDLKRYLNSAIDASTILLIKGNNNTLKVSVRSTEEIDFTKSDSIGQILGFAKRKIKANNLAESDFTANVLKVNSFCVDCNITIGSYKNGKLDHSIFQFSPAVPPGYKISISPQNVIYLPINTNMLTNIIVKILDQDGEIVNFREEVVTIGLHLKKVS